MSDTKTVEFNLNDKHTAIAKRLEALYEQRHELDIQIAAERGKIDLLAEILQGGQEKKKTPAYVGDGG